MTKILKYIIPVIIILIIACIGCLLYWHYQKPDDIEVFPSRPGDVKQMVHLCSVEIYNEVPVLDTVNGKVVFAIQKQNGTISFDVENLTIDDTGDTVRLQLPREIVDVYESTDKNAWEVIDTKSIGIMPFLRKLSVTEENRVKAKLKANSIKKLYTNGTVRQARKDAVNNLTRLLETVYRKPVIVSDPTPDGSPR